MKVRLLVMTGLVLSAFSSPIFGMENIFAQASLDVAPLNQLLQEVNTRVGFKKTADEFIKGLEELGVSGQEAVSVVHEKGATELYNKLYKQQTDLQKERAVGNAIPVNRLAQYSALSFYRNYLIYLGTVVNFTNLKKELTTLHPDFKKPDFNIVWTHGFFMNDPIAGPSYNQKIDTIFTDKAAKQVWDNNPQLLDQFNAISAKYRFGKQLVKNGNAYELNNRSLEETYALEYLLDSDPMKEVTLDRLKNNEQNIIFPDLITIEWAEEQKDALGTRRQTIDPIYRFLKRIIKKYDSHQSANVVPQGSTHGSPLPQSNNNDNNPLMVHESWKQALAKNSQLNDAQLLFNALKKVAKVTGNNASEMEQCKDAAARRQLGNQLNEESAQSIYNDATLGIANRAALSLEAKQLVEFLENSGKIRRRLVDIPNASFSTQPQEPVEPNNANTDRVQPSAPPLDSSVPLHDDVTILLQKMGMAIDDFDAALAGHGLSGDHIELIHKHGLFENELKVINQVVLNYYQQKYLEPDVPQPDLQPQQGGQQGQPPAQPGSHSVLSNFSPLLIAGSVIGSCLLIAGAGLGIYRLIKSIRIKKIKEQCKHIASAIALVEKNTVTAQQYRALVRTFSLVPQRINNAVEKALVQSDYEKALTLLRTQEKRLQALS